MNYLIIGNGFDIAHGLKTKYKDFLSYVIQRDKSLYFNFCKNNSECNLTFVDGKVLEKYISKNIWIYYFTSLYKENLIRGNNWIDFEREISYVVEFFDKHMDDKYKNLPTINDLNQDKKLVFFYNYFGNLYTGGVSNVDKHSYVELIETIYNDLKRLILVFNYYLKHEIESIDVKVRSKDISELKLDGVLSFNYTTTLKRLYKNAENTPIHYIHGSVSDESECNIVLGIDEYWNMEEASEHTDFNCMKKFTQRVINNTGVDYRKWIWDATGSGQRYAKKRETTSYKELGLSNVYIYGHSLDITDTDILKEIFLNNHIVVNIFYRDTIHQSDLIAAIVRMISEEEFVQQYNAFPQMIKFIKQQELV